LKIFVLLFLISILATSSIILSADGQREANFTKNPSKLSFSDKISPIIQQWRTSLEPESFAHDNNLKYSDGKITVYLYLTSSEHRTQIPEEIEIISYSDNIVVANIDSRQITQLSLLEFVQRIDSPVSGSLSQQTTIKKFPENSEKISETILDWQNSNDPLTFLEKNKLDSKDGKLKIYIYLSEAESTRDLSSYIDVLSKSENIVVSYASSQQITQLSLLEFVQRIDLPVTSSFPPSPEFDKVNEDENSYIIYGLVVAAIVIGALLFYRRKFTTTIKP